MLTGHVYDFFLFLHMLLPPRATRPATIFPSPTFFRSLATSLRRASAAWSATIAALGIGAAMVASWLAYSRAGLLFDPIYPAVAVLGVHLSSSLLRYLRTEREKHQIRTAFAFYMAPALEIGSASCRERVCQYVSSSVGAVSLNKKTYKEKTKK